MDSKHGLKQLILYFSKFEDDALDRVLDCFKPVRVKKNDILLKEGDTCKEFYYVHKGCIRTFFISAQGRETTRYILPEPSIGTALTSFITRAPSFESVDALEDTELLAISHHDFYRLTEELPPWKDFYLKVMEMAYVFQNKKIASLVTLTAKERYEQLINENPKTVQRLSNKIVASYLDINQETLSRLKSK